jgi:hypothetical protein
VWRGRDFYGALKVKEFDKPGSDNYLRRLVHGAILHGEQYQADWARKYATTYYTASSGIGPRDRYQGAAGRFDPRGDDRARRRDDCNLRPQEGRFPVLRDRSAGTVVARKYFTYLADSEAQVDIVLGDGRLSIEREEPQRYDVLAVDAFSGDAIPAHLITREAVQLFRRHLAPGGILAYHVSNRYLDLSPVVGKIAREEQMTALQFDDFKAADDTNPIKSVAHGSW